MSQSDGPPQPGDGPAQSIDPNRTIDPNSTTDLREAIPDWEPAWLGAPDADADETRQARVRPPSEAPVSAQPPPSLPPPSLPPRPRTTPWSAGSAASRNRIGVHAPDPARQLLGRTPAAAPVAESPNDATAATPSQAAAATPLELLWIDEDRSADIADNDAWLQHFPPAPPPPPRALSGLGPGLFDNDEGDEDEPPTPEIPPRQLVTAVLRNAEATPIRELANLMRAALTDSDQLKPPLVVVHAQLTLHFGLRDELQEYIATAKPAAKHHKKLSEALTHAEDMLETPIDASPKVGRAVIDQLRRAWREANRLLPDDYLDTSVERVLLTKRAYERSALLDGVWLRGSACGRRSPKPQVTVYLPEKMAQRLPLFRQLSTQMIAEVLPQQDSRETSTTCLRVIALARRVGEEGELPRRTHGRYQE